MVMQESSGLKNIANKDWKKPYKIHNCDLCPWKQHDRSGAWMLNLTPLTPEGWSSPDWPYLISLQQKWPQEQGAPRHRRAQPAVSAICDRAVGPLRGACVLARVMWRVCCRGLGSGCTQPCSSGKPSAVNHSSLMHGLRGHLSGVQW